MDSKDSGTSSGTATAALKSQPPVPEKTEARVKRPKKKGGCLRGCLVFLLVTLLVLGVLAALIFRIPQKMGWVKSAGARFTEMTHERLTAQEIVAEAEGKGFKSKGAQVFVFPKPDSGEAVLYATFDLSKNFEPSSAGQYSPIVATLVLLGGGEKAKVHAVTHVGAEFRDEEGNLLFTAVVSTADIRELAEGKITEDEFMKRVDRAIDLPNFINRAVIPF